MFWLSEVLNNFNLADVLENFLFICFCISLINNTVPGHKLNKSISKNSIINMKTASLINLTRSSNKDNAGKCLIDKKFTMLCCEFCVLTIFF